MIALWIAVGFTAGTLVTLAVFRSMWKHGLLNTTTEPEVLIRDRLVPVPCDELIIGEPLQFTIEVGKDGRVCWRINNVEVAARSAIPESVPVLSPPPQ